MAFAHPHQSRVLVPNPNFFDTRTPIFLPPPPPLLLPPPPPPPGFFPIGFRFDLNFVARMDRLRTETLVQFMVNEGLEPSAEEEMKRREVIEQLKQIVLAWIRKVASKHGLPKEVIASTSATILTYGSYGLGVHGSGSDIDALCVGPNFATLKEDFFIFLHDILHSRPEVSDIHCVKTAKVPLMRFKFNGISVDFPYAQLHATSVSDDMDLFAPDLAVCDETSLRSLSGVRANHCILRLFQNLKVFQTVLRCIKLWARRRGIYSHLLGFFGGIHLAILVAFVCHRHPNASISSLMSIFFDCFSHWPWPQPVILLDTIPYRRPDGHSFMPIMMPCLPFDWCNSNITISTFNKIRAELQRGFLITQDLGRADFNWRDLFEPFPYAKRYRRFLRIMLSAPDDDALRDWVGWVKSRFRSLLLKLENVQGFCDPNPTEYLDPKVTNPSVVFYWGLSPKRNGNFNIYSVKNDFLRSVNRDNYSDTNTNLCKIELLIVGSNQLPVKDDTGDT